MLTRLLLARRRSGVSVAGGDDRELHGRRVHGYSVLGGSERMHVLIRSQDVDTVLLGTSIEDQGRVAELKRLCSDYSVSLCRMDIGVRNLLDKQ